MEQRTSGSELARTPRQAARTDAAERWAAGHGVIRHRPATVRAVRALAGRLAEHGPASAEGELFELLHAADRVASAGLWLVVHQTYAKTVHVDGRPLSQEEFKRDPEGHTGGALNVAIAYAGYLVANAISGRTRAWLMGQGHTVAAIDSVNLIVGNVHPEHARRYAWSDEGLSRYARDFYSYVLDGRGRQDSPLGSHVNAHTAGGLIEGGYLGFAELLYVHMPLPGEQLVTFLSDGAFEEQRGGDWAPRWWRAEDSGEVLPILINNGRRIDQRTTTAQQGGVAWFQRHLRLNGFDPLVFDGRDPAAFAWAILEMEERLRERGRSGGAVRLPHGIAVVPKGFGFPGAGTNAAHNLPLGENPSSSARAARRFNQAARKLWVEPAELTRAVERLTCHARSKRPRERDHPLVRRELVCEDPPALEPRPARAGSDAQRWPSSSPMEALDRAFLAAVLANPHLRPRVGNPDEMRSNRMGGTLDRLKHRVTDPEEGVAESRLGAVITALNEEAVCGAALGNEGGINLVVSYEAFAVKMLGMLRQKIVFAQHLLDAGRPRGALSVPVILTSHLWENGKNEQSHQDPTLCEALLAEAGHVSRVLFPPDANCAAEALLGCFRTRDQVWALVVPKGSIADAFTPVEARAMLNDGGASIDWLAYEPERARLFLVAVGAYQLAEVARASRRLAERGVEHAVSYLLEPGRFRRPRDEREAALAASEAVRARLFPGRAEARLLVAHGHPEPLVGALEPELSGPRTAALGWRNHGGTLDAAGLLFLNRSSWAHVLEAGARLLDLDRSELLEAPEIEALDGRRSPQGVILPVPHAD
jgi:phosphoketolase